jgi:spermidine synthase
LRSPPLIGPDATLSTNITAERNNLMAFYAAGIAAYTGDRQAWANQITQVLHQDPGNPYYRWAVGQP